jgi:hypothetical protein
MHTCRDLPPVKRVIVQVAAFRRSDDLGSAFQRYNTKIRALPRVYSRSNLAANRIVSTYPQPIPLRFSCLLAFKLSSAHQRAKPHSKAKSNGDELKPVGSMKRLGARVTQAVHERESTQQKQKYSHG